MSELQVIATISATPDIDQCALVEQALKRIVQWEVVDYSFTPCFHMDYKAINLTEEEAIIALKAIAKS